MRLFKWVILILLISVFRSYSQKPIDSTNFRSPLKIPLILSGNFCELRPNHFHTGLDIKTGGVIGKEVVSIEEGYVSRIFYSHWGYGLAVYVTHPNGYTSVYAHLSSYCSKIKKKVKEVQYEKESETFNVYLEPNEITLKKGEKIGLSGTSGSSYAPHLHFELRETESELAINPLLFGFNIIDHTKPDVKGVKFYPISDNATINGKHQARYVPTKRIKAGKYGLKYPVKAFGQIALGIHTTDRLDGAGNICGVYHVDVSCNDELIFNHHMKYMDFDKNRYINHHMDYHEFTVNRKNIHKNFLKGNNKLPIYGKHKNRGIFTVESDSTYKINYVIKDAYKNTSYLNFKISGDNSSKSKFERNNTNCTRYFKYDKGVFFDTIGFTLLMAKGTIYDDHCFNYYVVKDSSFLSDVHVVNNKAIPIHHYFEMQIKPRDKWAEEYKDKLIIVEITDKGYQVNKEGIFVDGVVHTRVRSYGKYAINIDTTMPWINILTPTKHLKKVTSKSKIKFKIGDNLSGVKDYDVYLNGNWILSNYNRKKGTLLVSLSEGVLEKGKNIIKVVVEDERLNQRVKLIELN